MFSDNPVHIALLSAFALMAVIQAWFWLRYFRKAAFTVTPEDDPSGELPPLSVIICARNEAKNLRSFLPSVLVQDYPSFEVIVVNDCSEDDTYDVLGEMMKKYSNLKVSSIQKDPGFTHAKKLAMLIGIKAAANDLLVFTDADCHPISDKWLRCFAAAARPGKEITLGYGGYSPDKGLMNNYIRYETMFIGMQYMGMALAGVPYMGVGRNLSYRKSYFFSRGGFGPFNHIMSGDDDLFVNRNATSSNCSVMLSPESMTRSVAPATLREWIRQKHRHLTTAKYYKPGDKFRLFMEPFSRVSYYGLLTAMLIMLSFWPVVAAIALMRLVMRSIIVRKTALAFREPRLWFFSLFFDILSPFVSTLLFLTNTGKGKRKQSWK